MKKLDERETKFKQKYLLTGKPYESAIYAGYAETTAKTKAFTWVSDGKCPKHKLHLLEAIKQAQAARSERTKVDADWMLKRLQEEADADLAELYYPEGGLKPVHEWPEIWRKGLVAGLDVEQQYVWQDGEKVPDGFVTKVKLADRGKRLEMIGRHIDVQAFKDRLDMNVTGRAERMEKARKRASGE